MKIKYIVILVIFVFSLQSCEWTKKKLGLLTKHEIAAMGDFLEQQKQQKELLNSAAVDTTINSVNDSIADNSQSLESNNSQEKKIVEQEKKRVEQPVVVEEKKPAEPKKTVPVQEKKTDSVQAKKIDQSPDGMFYIVLGSFRDVQNADKLVEKVEKLGYSAKKLSLQKGLETVAIGGYNSNADALAAMEEIKQESFYSKDFWIYKKRK